MPSWRSKLSRIQKISVVLLALLCLFTAVSFWRETLGTEKGGRSIATWEKRLEPVRKALPFKQGVVGYVADWDVPGVNYAMGDMEAEFGIVQYTLAPLIVRRGAAAEWNVAVITPPTLSLWQQAHPEEFEVYDLGHNVYLFHRRGNQ